MTTADFRRLALALPDAVESSHMGSADFRIHGRVFATLAHAKQGLGNLMLTPEVQAGFLADAPGIFLPISGGWGRMGMTHIRLAEATEDVVADALQTAYKLRVKKNAKATRKKAATRAG